MCSSSLFLWITILEFSYRGFLGLILAATVKLWLLLVSAKEATLRVYSDLKKDLYCLLWAEVWLLSWFIFS